MMNFIFFIKKKSLKKNALTSQTNMVLTNLKGKNINKINFIIIIFLFFSSCSGNKCSPIELELQQLVIENDSIYSIPLNSLTDFEWTELYVISGPRFPSEVEDIIGMKYEKTVQDDSRKLIFIHDAILVKEYTTTCRNFSWGRVNSGYKKLMYKSNLQVQKRMIANEWWLYEVVY